MEHISHVINFDMPATADDYIHRIGRTGRAEHTGDAFTLVTPDDKDMIRALEKILGKPLSRQTLEGFDYNVPAPATYVPATKTPSGARPHTRTASRPERRPGCQPDQNRGLRQKFASPGKKST